MSAHTPTPWRAVGQGGTADGGSSKQHPCFLGRILNDDGQVIVSDGMFLGVIGATPEEAEANAEFIVRAVNSHEDLLAIAKRALSESARVHPDFRVDILAAIEKAEVVTP